MKAYIVGEKTVVINKILFQPCTGEKLKMKGFKKELYPFYKKFKLTVEVPSASMKSAKKALSIIENDKLLKAEKIAIEKGWIIPV